MRTGSAPGFAPSQTLLHFGTVVDGQFKERRQVKLVPPVAGGIPIIAPDGNLLLIDKASGNMVIVDSRAKGGTVVRLAEPAPVKAAAADSDYVYLLSGDSVIKTDLARNQIDLRNGAAQSGTAAFNKLCRGMRRLKHDLSPAVPDRHP
jgi:hypothetical protein